MADLQKVPETPIDESEPRSAWPYQPWLWPYVAAKLALNASSWWINGGLPAPEPRNEHALGWATPNKIALELSCMRLRDFSRAETGQPTLVCAPYALHSASITDLTPGHSLVEALHRGGLDRVFVTDWRSATPDMRYLSIDNYLSDLNVAIDEVGAPADLIGLCQGGWLSLLYAARFPDKIRRLVLAGAPVDVSVPSDLSQMVASTPPEAYEGFIGGAGVVSGNHMLRFWTSPFSAQEVEIVLQRDLVSDPAGKELLDRFFRWNKETLDLPGTYYLQVVNWIFRQNRLATGDFVALGKQINLAEVAAPVYLLAGGYDEVVPADQAFATALLLGAPPAVIERASDSCRHLSLFMGGKTLTTSWSQIAHWLQSDATDLRRRRAESA
jgi:poly(3-hydroxyalkanoate) synthetase